MRSAARCLAHPRKSADASPASPASPASGAANVTLCTLSLCSGGRLNHGLNDARRRFPISLSLFPTMFPPLPPHETDHVEMWETARDAATTSRPTRKRHRRRPFTSALFALSRLFAVRLRCICGAWCNSRLTFVSGVSSRVCLRRRRRCFTRRRRAVLTAAFRGGAGRVSVQSVRPALYNHRRLYRAGR